MEVTVNTCNICNINSSGKISAEWVTLCEKICRVGNACNICIIDFCENSVEGVMYVICVILTLCKKIAEGVMHVIHVILIL